MTTHPLAIATPIESESIVEGVISSVEDQDRFHVWHSGGTFIADVAVLESGFAGTATNLNVDLKLQDSLGNQVLAESSPDDRFSARIETELTAGLYSVRVSGGHESRITGAIHAHGACR